jgi:hypothetical protein
MTRPVYKGNHLPSTYVLLRDEQGVETVVGQAEKLSAIVKKAEEVLAQDHRPVKIAMLVMGFERQDNHERNGQANRKKNDGPKPGDSPEPPA